MRISRTLARMLLEDRRFALDAYLFIAESLCHAQELLAAQRGVPSGGPREDADPHLTGPELCEAIRLRALDQFGLLAKAVLNTWGIHSTGDIGDVVYNLIRIGEMRKSKRDRREDFDGVFDFDDALRRRFEFTVPK
ncbi:MAG: hypothetical protein FJ297_06245 [Planctomycetes bacterium]|nr:hypothetical protein [Planctomycetota bacterium]